MLIDANCLRDVEDVPDVKGVLDVQVLDVVDAVRMDTFRADTTHPTLPRVPAANVG